MEPVLESAQDQFHNDKLNSTLRELTRKVREHERELEKVRASSRSGLGLSPTAQLQVVQAALREVTEEEPFLPFPESVLPALLALRKTQQTIVESRQFLTEQEPKVTAENKQLASDQANLKDQQLITDALTTRIDSLKKELGSTEETVDPEEGVRERLQNLKSTRRRYDDETSKLIQFLDKFVKSTLAGMLAAEELGGPVVGDLMDVDADDLAGGFTAQGQLKKTKAGDKKAEDKRQRRIDEIWGSRATQRDGEDEPEGADETSAAGREMKHLIEQLLTALDEAKGNSSASYVQLERESAAARFLVRSKLAQLSPRDALKLRLIDFGREIGD